MWFNWCKWLLLRKFTVYAFVHFITLFTDDLGKFYSFVIKILTMDVFIYSKDDIELADFVFLYQEML